MNPSGPRNRRNREDDRPGDLRDARPHDASRDDDYDDWELDEFEELNRSGAKSTFLERPWFRWAAIAFAGLIVLSFAIPMLTALLANDRDQSTGDSFQRVPDFQLRTAAGRSVRLSDVAEDHNSVVVLFHRGVGCAACVDQLIDFQAAYPGIRAQGAELLAVSPGTATDASNIANRVRASFPVLYDPDGNVIASMGLDEALAEGGFVSAVYLLDRRRELQARPVGSTASNLLPGTAIVEALRQLNDGQVSSPS